MQRAALEASYCEPYRHFVGSYRYRYGNRYRYRDDDNLWNLNGLGKM